MGARRAHGISRQARHPVTSDPVTTVTDARIGRALPRVLAVASEAPIKVLWAVSHTRSAYISTRCTELEAKRFVAACVVAGYSQSDGLRAAMEAFADAITESLKSRDQGVENPGREVPAKAEGRPETLARS